jgi:8-oxo-dGTP diphosphatase
MLKKSERIRVVAAVIRSDDRFLLALRPQGREEGGKWEFPGGKVELGETEEAALGRELYEELGVKAKVLKRVCEIRDAERPLSVCFLEARIEAGTPKPFVHDRISWLTRKEIEKTDLSSLDRAFALAYIED